MIKEMARIPASILVGLCAVGLVEACANTQSAETVDASGKGGTGGLSAAGGATSGGGTMAASRSTPGNGGATSNATPAGGSSVVSSTPNSGTSSDGGSSAAGGVTSAGGSIVSGGTPSGGASATGGIRSSGGVNATSGSEPAGGTTASASDAGANDVRSSDAGGGEKNATPADAVAVTSDASRDTATGKGDAPATVSYKTQIEPLLKANCVSCHGATVQNMSVRVDTYTNVKASLSDVTDLLVNGGMPPAGPLSDADIQLFQAWVDQGAPNN